MWISRKKWNHLEERISALERKEQERIARENYHYKPGTKIIKKNGGYQRVPI